MVTKTYTLKTYLAVLNDEESQKHEIVTCWGDNLHQICQDIEDIVASKNLSRKLHEKVLYPSNFDRLLYRDFKTGEFSQEACAVRLSNSNPNSGNLVSLVLGASGSGKTVYSTLEYPKTLYKPFEDSQKGKDKEAYYVTVLLKASEHIPVNVASEDELVKTFSKSIQEEIKRLCVFSWNDFFIKKNLSFPQEGLLDLMVCVVIDEAGGSSSKALFPENDLEVLNKVARQVQTGLNVGEVHLTMAGTGLEQLTQNIDSSIAYQKIRMKEWSSNEFKHICTQDRKEDHLKVIEKYPVLENLITNARCAFFVNKALDKFNTWDGTNTGYGFINAVVHYVAASYRNRNALTSVKTEREIQLMTGIVLRVLHDPIERHKNGKELKFYDFEQHKGLNVDLHMCQGLLDCHLDKKDNEVRLSLEELKYGYSISPALTVLLAVFLGDCGEVGWNEKRLETIVALSELMGKLRKEELNKNFHPRRIVFSPKSTTRNFN